MAASCWPPEWSNATCGKSSIMHSNNITSFCALNYKDCTTTSEQDTISMTTETDRQTQGWYVPSKTRPVKFKIKPAERPLYSLMVSGARQPPTLLSFSHIFHWSRRGTEGTERERETELGGWGTGRASERLLKVFGQLCVCARQKERKEGRDEWSGEERDPSQTGLSCLTCRWR